MDNILIDPNIKSENDYKRLVEIFGVKELNDNIINLLYDIVGDLHVLIRRRFFYAHRDFDILLNEYNNGKKFFLYTGRAPSKSKMHIGHLIPFIFTKWLQDKFDVNLYIQIPDEEKYWEKKADNYSEIKEYAIEDAKTIASVGFNPDKTFIFINSEYIDHLYKPAIYIAREINLNTAKNVFGFDDESTIGLPFYIALQIVPTFFENGVPLIPCGVDQDPYFRLQRDIAPKFGYNKASTILSKFVWGLQGPYTKMSASDPKSAIFIDDDYDTIKEKINKYAFSGGKPTLEEHRKYGGNPDIDVSYFWLSVLFEEDDKKLFEIREKYIQGELTTGELKSYTIEKIWSFIKEIQDRRKNININKYMYDGKLAKEMWDWEFEL
ncbi:tryptophan--tRNA ligase [Nanobdella aerobiophila]|uniref:Tryptophan--tRNA ligase n=1 Tax=Nanobdella aerobiophila TaxID=2586965 RepID=A0A915WSZ5_9ARCH|nr:tryptophan--tRNA ligase [Nanobdella aerobiophila]BBL45820.1 tryptophan--tRNA ligase [Nanobdella aerobiophila]